MKFLFDDESFSFETLRTAGFAAYGGADLGEVLTTTRHIAEGDEAGWHQAWEEYYRGMVARCYPVITSEIGRELPVPIDSIRAFTRNEWIDANIANFKELFGPIEAMYSKPRELQGLQRRAL